MSARDAMDPNALSPQGQAMRLIIKGAVSELEPEDQTKFEVAYQKIRQATIDGGDAGLLALAMCGCEAGGAG